MLIQSFIDNTPYKSDTEFSKLNPFTNEVLHTVSGCDLLGLISAIQSANRAFAEWKSTSLDDRLAVISRIENILSSRAQEFARLEAADQGLSAGFVLEAGITSALKTIADLKNERPQLGASFSPVGVVAIVASWNLSLRLVLERLVPALLAGNSVVVKVSSVSPVTAHVLAEIVTAAQLPKGLVNVIVTNELDVKTALVSHPGVRAVSFTGRIETATELLPLINKTSLQSFKKIQISSGSKNSAVVLAEPGAQFEAVMNSFMQGQGQLGWNSSRLFVLEKFESEWQERITTYLSGLKPSEGIDDPSTWTPCLKASSFAKFDEIRNTAFEDKAKLLETPYDLSEKQKKNFLPPVFTKDMSRCSTLQQDQIHSPFFILSAVKYPFDVPKYSNVSYFGFAAHLWGEPEKLAKIADGLDVGLVTINKASVDVPGAVAAVKQSGFGLQDFQTFGVFFSNVKKLS
jgi:aminomuconate-semialdehyde/2-hydroxymuconate-6-semialdehyde dehydrogenase